MTQEPDTGDARRAGDEDDGDRDDEGARGGILDAFLPHGPLQVAIAVLALCFLAGAVGYLIGTRQPPVATSAIDQGFLIDMSAHHDQAITMALCTVNKAEDELVQHMAREVLIFQNQELARMASLLEQMRTERPSDTGRTAMEWMGMPVAVEQMPGMATQDQLDELCSATGREVDEQFLRLMRAHHEGGVHMAEMAATDAANPSVRKLAEVMARNQKIEANEYTAHLERLGFAP